MLKKYRRNSLGRENYESEIVAAQVFSDCTWKMPVEKRVGWVVASPLYDQAWRLDRAAVDMTDSQKLVTGIDALEVLLEIYLTGYVHRDASARNFYVTPTGLVLGDFETCIPLTRKVPFLASYDVTGKGPEHVHGRTGGAFGSEDQEHFRVDRVVEHDLAPIINGLRSRLREINSVNARKKLVALSE